MSDFLKHVQVRITKKKLYKDFLAKLDEEGMTQQGFLLSRIKKFVNGSDRKKKRKN